MSEISPKEGKAKQGIKKPKPLVLSINICDAIIRDEATKKVSLVGLFSIIKASNFPAKHPLFHIYVALTNGHGIYKTEIKFLNLDDNKPIAGMEGDLNFNNPLQVVEINFALEQIRLEKPGKYGVQVICDGDVISTRNFTVVGPQEKITPTSGTEVR